MRDEIKTGSRMCRKCQECAYKEDCQNKRLEAFCYIVPQEVAQINSPITNVNTNNLDISELTKQIEKNLKKLHCRQSPHTFVLLL